MNLVCRLMLLLLLCTAAGCPTNTGTAPPAELPLAGQTVEIVAPSDLALQEAWQPLIAEWKAQTGGDVVWTEFASDSPPWQGDAAKSSANGGRITVAAITDLSDAEKQGFFAPIPMTVQDQIDQRDVLPGLKDAVLSREKRLVAIPVSAPVLLCYYRQDLLEAAGRTPPQTWDDYQTLLDELEQWAPGLSACEPCGPEFRATLFLARAAAFVKHPQNYSAWFDIQTSQPVFDSPAFARALDVSRKAWQKMPEDIWNFGPTECRAKLRAGQAALILSVKPGAAYPLLIELPASDPDSQEPLAIGVCQLPGTREVYQRDSDRWEQIKTTEPYQPGLVGFTGIVMGASATDDRAAAWNLLQTLSKQLASAFAERPRSVCRESESLSGFPSGGLAVEANSLLTDATAQTLRRRDAVGDLPVPGAAPLRKIIAEELAAAKSDQATGEILAAIQRRLVEATESRREALRDDYRRAVGLGPLKTTFSERGASAP